MDDRYGDSRAGTEAVAGRDMRARPKTGERYGRERYPVSGERYGQGAPPGRAEAELETAPETEPVAGAAGAQSAGAAVRGPARTSLLNRAAGTAGRLLGAASAALGTAKKLLQGLRRGREARSASGGGGPDVKPEATSD